MEPRLNDTDHQKRTDLGAAQRRQLQRLVGGARDLRTRLYYYGLPKVLSSSTAVN